MSRRCGTSTSLVLEPPSSVHSVKSFAANFSPYRRSRSASRYRADRRRVIRRFAGNGGICRSTEIDSAARSDFHRGQRTACNFSCFAVSLSSQKEVLMSCGTSW